MRTTSMLLLSLLLMMGASDTFADSNRNSRAVTLNISLSIPDRVIPDESTIKACARQHKATFDHAQGNCRTPRSLLQTARYEDKVTVRVTPI
ncbi:MAG: hypothetical protein WD002_12295 [Pseudomonadales bacterium]